MTYFYRLWYNVNMQKIAKWCDEWKLAASGIVLATKNWKFDLIAAVSFVVFGVLMNLLYNGFATFKMLFQMDWAGKWQILSNAFLALFGVNRSFGDWALVFFISVLQGILIGLVALVWKKRQNSADVQNVGIVTGLAVLGSGCPTCGTTLLAPVIGAISSTGGYALAGTVSWLLTVAAIIIALLAVKKVGEEAYVIIISEKYQKEKK